MTKETLKHEGDCSGMFHALYKIRFYVVSVYLSKFTSCA
jgi:hypothetical protein